MASPILRVCMSTLVVVFCVLALLALIIGGIKEARGEPVDISSIACYEHGDELVAPEFENHNLMIKVNWFETHTALRAELISYYPDDPEWVAYIMGAEAYSVCEVHYEDGADVGFCEIWVMRPRYVLADPGVDALGHEVLHGLIGDYHE